MGICDDAYLVVYVLDVGEWSLLVQQQIQDASQRPDVGLFRHLDLGLRSGRTGFRRGVDQGLWANVIEGTGLGELHNTSGIESNVAGNAEVDQLEASFDHEKISGFQIQMDDSVLVNVMHALHHLIPNLHQRIQWDVLTVVLKNFVEIAVSLFHHKKELIRFGMVTAAK